MTKPHVFRPFDDETFANIKEHVAHVRRCFDSPGAEYHDKDAAEGARFNRWYWHNLPMLVALHHSPAFIAAASEIFGELVKPSYVFLSMYGPAGICPPHTDRPQCKYTIDLLVDQDGGTWPIEIHDNAAEDSNRTQILLKPGEAVAYSGTQNRHYRDTMTLVNPTPTFANLAFFHFVPAGFVGNLG